MIIDLEEAKLWLRIDHDEEDALIQTLIDDAESYLKNATGNDFDSSNPQAKIYCFVMVTDRYTNRDLTAEKVHEKIKLTYQSLMTQLTYCY